MRGQSASELINDIERQIGDGTLSPGDRLPAVRALAETLDLAPNTVAAAYRALGRRGVVVGRGRHGTFVAARPPLAGPAAVRVPTGAIDLATGNPDRGLLPDPTRWLADAAQSTTVLYGNTDVDPDLADHAAASFRDDGVTTDDVAVVAGALDGLERVLTAHLRPGDTVAIEDPAYASVIDLLGALTLNSAPCPVDEHGMEPAGLTDALRRGAGAVVVTPRAHNPTGAATTPERAVELRDALAGHPDVVVIEDDHAGLVAGAPFVSVTGTTDRWAVTRSVAKSLGPDLRLAMLAADDTTLQRVRGRQRIGPGWVSHLLQRTVRGMLQDPSVVADLAAAAETYTTRRNAFRTALADRNIASFGRSGLNVWVPVRDEAAAVAGMMELGFAVRSGATFRLRSEAGIRITTASLTDPVPVADALARVLGDTNAVRSG